MADPRLDSIHLDVRRREEFRQAREHLLQARGSETQMYESRDSLEAAARGGPSNTLIQQNAAPISTDHKFYVQDKEFIYPLKVGLNTVGRLPDNDIVINDAHVSRRHCAIVVHSRDSCEIHDVASKNGTYLNALKLNGPTPLNTGDEIRMCDHTISFHVQKTDVAANAETTSPPTEA